LLPGRLVIEMVPCVHMASGGRAILPWYLPIEFPWGFRGS
jgi:hypothetical protein